MTGGRGGRDRRWHPGRLAARIGAVPQPLSELIDPGWAHALGTVEPKIRELGEFLRQEVAEGRGYRPAGEHVLAAVTRPLAQGRGPTGGQEPERRHGT